MSYLIESQNKYFSMLWWSYTSKLAFLGEWDNWPIVIPGAIPGGPLVRTIDLSDKQKRASAPVHPRASAISRRNITARQADRWLPLPTAWRPKLFIGHLWGITEMFAEALPIRSDRPLTPTLVCMYYLFFLKPSGVISCLFSIIHLSLEFSDPFDGLWGMGIDLWLCFVCSCLMWHQFENGHAQIIASR